MVVIVAAIHYVRRRKTGNHLKDAHNRDIEVTWKNSLGDGKVGPNLNYNSLKQRTQANEDPRIKPNNVHSLSSASSQDLPVLVLVNQVDRNSG